MNSVAGPFLGPSFDGLAVLSMLGTGHESAVWHAVEARWCLLNSLLLGHRFGSLKDLWQGFGLLLLVLGGYDVSDSGVHYTLGVGKNLGKNVIRYLS